MHTSPAGVHLKINDSMKRLSRVGTVSSECPVVLTTLGTYFIVSKPDPACENQSRDRIQVTGEGDGRTGDRVQAQLQLFQHNSHVLSQLVIREEFYFLENGLNLHYHPL